MLNFNLLISFPIDFQILFQMIWWSLEPRKKRVQEENMNRSEKVLKGDLYLLGRASQVAQWYRICLLMQETWIRSLGGKDTLEKPPTLVFLPGKIHGQRSLAGYSPWSPERIEHNLATRCLATKHVFEKE